MSRWILTLTCVDRPGIIAAVSECLLTSGASIVEAQEFSDPETHNFFMRIVFEAATHADAGERARILMADVEARFAMGWTLRESALRKRVLILTSRFDHCLGDLLYRMRIGELAMDVVGIVSNHPRDALHLTTFGSIPYHHLPVSSANRAEQEAEILRIARESEVELVVLARYMQVLSDGLASALSGRCINIHHSFLPGFKGGKPYHQAYSRGVKMIGATAHFVTADLDEGPIIAQDVETITHFDTPEDMIRKGRNIEQRVLSRAVTWLLDDRVLLNGTKTVVFAR